MSSLFLCNVACSRKLAWKMELFVQPKLFPIGCSLMEVGIYQNSFCQLWKRTAPNHAVFPYQTALLSRSTPGDDSVSLDVPVIAAKQSERFRSLCSRKLAWKMELFVQPKLFPIGCSLIVSLDVPVIAAKQKKTDCCFRNYLSKACIPTAAILLDLKPTALFFQKNIVRKI